MCDRHRLVTFFALLCLASYATSDQDSLPDFSEVDALVEQGSSVDADSVVPEGEQMGMDDTMTETSSKGSLLATHFEDAAVEFINLIGSKCHASPAAVTKAAVLPGTLKIGAVDGTKVTATVATSTEDGSEKNYDFTMVQNRMSVPKRLPSIWESNVDSYASDPLVTFSVSDVKPSPCPGTTFESAVYPEEIQLGMQRGDMPMQATQFYEESNVQVAADTLPLAWDWTDKEPTSDAFTPRSQGGCGSSWAFAASTVLSARFSIATNGTSNPALAPQWFVSCETSPATVGGCDGGNFYSAVKAMSSSSLNKGAVDETCNPYVGLDNVPENACNQAGGDPIPMSCARYFSKPYNCKSRSYIKKINSKAAASSGATEAAIQTELMTNGPLYVSMNVYEDFKTYRSGVYKHTTGNLVGSHAVALVGWGEHSGEHYWLAQNSWSADWGEQGFFRISRGGDDGAGFQTSGVYAALANTAGQCSNTCVHGSMDSACSCHCDAGYGGKDCSVCLLSCTGFNFKGSICKDKCACECQDGYHGKKCGFEVNSAQWSVGQVGVPVTLDYTQNLDPEFLQPEDRVVLFPADDQELWSPEKGWAKAAAIMSCTPSLSAVSQCIPKGQLTFTASKVGDFRIVLIKHKGTDNHGTSKGYQAQSVLGEITIKPIGAVTKVEVAKSKKTTGVPTASQMEKWLKAAMKKEKKVAEYYNIPVEKTSGTCAPCMDAGTTGLCAKAAAALGWKGFHEVKEVHWLESPRYCFAEDSHVYLNLGTGKEATATNTIACMCNKADASSLKAAQVAAQAAAAAKEKASEEKAAKKAAQAAKSYKPEVITSGTCCSAGCVDVDSQQQCTVASKTVGWPSAPKALLHTRTLPANCVFHQCAERKNVYFNLGHPTVASAKEASQDFNVVCRCPATKKEKESNKAACELKEHLQKERAAKAALALASKKNMKEARGKKFAAMEYKQKQWAIKIKTQERLFKHSSSSGKAQKEARAKADEAYTKYMLSKKDFKGPGDKKAEEAAKEFLAKRVKERSHKFSQSSTTNNKFVYCGFDKTQANELFAPSCKTCPSGFDGWCAGQCEYSSSRQECVSMNGFQFPSGSSSFKNLYKGIGKGKAIKEAKEPVKTSEKQQKKEQKEEEERKLKLVKFKDAKMGKFCGIGMDGNTPTYSDKCEYCPDGYAGWCSGECEVDTHNKCTAKVFKKEDDVETLLQSRFGPMFETPQGMHITAPGAQVSV